MHHNHLGVVVKKVGICLLPELNYSPWGGRHLSVYDTTVEEPPFYSLNCLPPDVNNQLELKKYFF